MNFTLPDPPGRTSARLTKRILLRKNSTKIDAGKILNNLFVWTLIVGGF